MKTKEIVFLKLPDVGLLVVVVVVVVVVGREGEGGGGQRVLGMPLDDHKGPPN